MRVTWDEALDLIAHAHARAARLAQGAEAILPFCYGGSNGLLTQDTNDATLFRALGTSRLARTVCAAPTGAANMALYGKMAGVTYQDYPHARLIVLWGVNPAASGIHLVPFLKEARDAGARWSSSIRARRRSRGRPTCTSRRGPAPICRSRSRFIDYLFEEGLAATAFLAEHTTGADQLRARAAKWTFERAAPKRGIDAGELRRFAELYAAASPALVRCGWGLERNRNGGSAAAAVLALPAVAGKFGVRGGGFSMSNSTALGHQGRGVDGRRRRSRRPASST